MGVIALFVAVLPRLAIGGRELFFAEAPGPEDEKVTPQIRRTALVLWRLYAGLTAAAGRRRCGSSACSLFDAVCHSMSTLAAGGFSPNPLSIAGYQNPAAEWIIIVFMFVAGANFARAVPRAVAARACGRSCRRRGAPRLHRHRGRGDRAARPSRSAGRAGLLATIRTALFQVLSIMTTTGFASVGLQAVERAGEDGAARADVRRRLRGIGRRRAEGRALPAARALHVAGTAAGAASARRAAGQARRARGARERDAGRAGRSSSFYLAHLRGLHRDRRRRPAPT